MEVTRSMVGRWESMGGKSDRSIEAKDGSGWGRTVGFGPHELRGDVLHVGKLPPRPWRPSSPGRVASSCGGGECRVRRENTLSVLRERLTFIFLGTALYDCQCMAYSLTRN